MTSAVLLLGRRLCSPVLARLSRLFWSRAPVIPLVSFFVPLFLPAPVSFFGLALQLSPGSESLFPSPSSPQAGLFVRSFSIFLWLVLTIGHKRGNFPPIPKNQGNFGHEGRTMGIYAHKIRENTEKDLISGKNWAYREKRYVYAQ